jgi:ABC-type transport system substrate-binding protein
MDKPAGISDLIAQALATPDYATEKKLCQQAVKMLVDDSTVIPVYISIGSYVLQKNVPDTNFSNLGRWTPGQALISK